MTLLTADIIEPSRKSVLCWLATADADGMPIVAPSYWLFPQEATPQRQVESAMCTYGMQPAAT